MQVRKAKIAIMSQYLASLHFTGDRQSSHPVKNPASVLWQVFRGVARCCLPRFQGQPQHLKYQNRIKKLRAVVPAASAMRLAATDHGEYITLVAGKRRSLLIAGNNVEVYDKKPQRYAEDNVTQ